MRPRSCLLRALCAAWLLSVACIALSTAAESSGVADCPWETQSQLGLDDACNQPHDDAAVTCNEDGTSTTSTSTSVSALDAVLSSPPSRVYVPVPAHLLEDDLPPLLQFDATRVHYGDEADSASDLPTSLADPTSFASLVLRVSRRVTSAGMWQPRKVPAHVHPMHHAAWQARHADDKDALTPPANAPEVVSSTLNLCVSAHYRVRTGVDVYRGLQIHVLPGPSFARGSLSALSESFGPDAIGFEQAFHAMHDQRRVKRTQPVREGSTTLNDGDEIAFEPNDPHMPAASHIPGYGPIRHLRTMSGQHSENWLVYSSGVYEGGRVVHDVAVFTLLVHVWSDPRARKEDYAHRTMDEHGVPIRSSMNARGLRLRVAADFTVRPMPYGVPLMKPRENLARHPMHMSAETTDMIYGTGLGINTDADGESVDVDPDATPVHYAKIVDLVSYQQKKLVFIGIAYDDGFLRIFSRGGTLRNEIRTRNSTILLIAMSNWGSSGSVGSAAAGGARDTNSALNGAQNGNQLVAYVTPSGIGLVKMARIYNEVDQYCRWDGENTGGVRSGYDVSSVAFDALSQGVLYVASHTDHALYVISSRLGWRTGVPNFDEHGRRIIEEGGNACQLHAAVKIALSPSHTHVSQATRTPQMELLSLRGLLILASDLAGTLTLFNTSTIARMPDEIGVEFISERQLAAPRQDANHERMHLAQLVGDRIDLLMVGVVRDATTTTTDDAPTPAPLHVMQLFFAQVSPPSLSGYAWLTSSRVPIFIVGLLAVFGYKYLQRRNRQRRAEEGGDDPLEDESFARGLRDPRHRSSRTAATAPPMDEHALLNAMSESVSSRSAKSNDDPFDSEEFMSDFLRWQQAQGAGAGAATAAGAMTNRRARDPTTTMTKGADYMDLLARDRARLGATRHSARPASSQTKSHLRSQAPSSQSMASFREAAASLEQRRIEMRRKLDAMNTEMRRATDAATMAAAAAGSIALAGEPIFHDLQPEELDDDTNETYNGVDELNEPGFDYEETYDQEPREDDADDDDGPTYHGSFDEYEYDHSQYVSNLGDAARPSGVGVIDEVDDEHEYDADAGARASRTSTFPIDAPFEEEEGEEVEEDDEEDFFATAPHPDELREEQDAINERAWRIMQARSARSAQVPPPNASLDPTATVAGFGFSADDISHYAYDSALGEDEEPIESDDHEPSHAQESEAYEDEDDADAMAQMRQRPSRPAQQP